ncbi:hypothetical protein [Thiospirillum jenense]|uniref:DUF2281 domain-containing protein n=1 Tax=Thiospirillum jenense TaxID=1653858 RepID=A0A839HJV2_9GAMM|nr:hypothetical protein [Thiospirillum jenense]MBB1127048.1 hypothetical protein [Thiospirillum jenense]
MHTAITGTYENGQVILDELPPTMRHAQVIVTFIENTEWTPNQGVKLGSLAQRGYSIPEDFNTLIDDFNEYF